MDEDKIKLTKDDLGKIKKISSVEEVYLSMGSVFVKKIGCGVDFDFLPLELATNEVIGYHMAKDMGLMCPFYQIVMPNYKKDDEVYVISENLNNYGKFKTFADLAMPVSCGLSLYEIWDYLENYYLLNNHLEEYVPSLFEDIIKIYIFDILTGNWDRFNRNWGLIINNNSVKMAIFDNEFIMDYQLPAISSNISGNVWSRKKNLTHDNKETLKEEIKQFLEESSLEFLKMFKDIVDKFSPEYFALLLEKVENESSIITNKGNIPLVIDDKEDYLTYYTDNYELIRDVLQEFKKMR